ncbi:MAG: DUF166 family protein [Candidatus Hodarchaeota archaeon]
MNFNSFEVGIISDGKYGERAFQNIKKKFKTLWILVPEIESNIFLDEPLNLDIPVCDLYVSYVRHPDIILQIAELQKPLILGILPGYGLYQQINGINTQVIHAPTMCSLENTTGIPEVDQFTKYFGKPIYEIQVNDNLKIENIFVKRSSLCGSSEAGAKFLENKDFNIQNLQEFALSVCHECRAPRFGRTCDKEVAGIIHLVSLFNGINKELLSKLDENMKQFVENMKNQYLIRKVMSKLD